MQTKLLWLGLCVVGTLASPVMAAGKEIDEKAVKEAETGEVVGETDEGKKIIKVEEDVVADSSEAHRQGKMASIVAEVGFTGMFTSGGAIGYYLSGNNLLEVSHVS